MNTDRSLKLTSFFRLAAITAFTALFFIPISAQPSGGPYGPVRQTWQIPQTGGKIIYVAPDGDRASTGESITSPRAIEVDGKDTEGISPESEHGKDVVGTTLEHCTISFCSRVAAYLRGDRLTIRNCKVSDTSTEGIYILSSSDVLLEKTSLPATILSA